MLFQKVTFGLVKDRLLAAKRPPFAWRFAVFCIAVDFGSAFVALFTVVVNAAVEQFFGIVPKHVIGVS